MNYIHISNFLKEKKFRHFDDRHGIPHTINQQVYEIAPGTYWLTCNAGLVNMQFDPEQPEKVLFENLTPDTKSANSIVNTHTIKIIQDKFGAYWVGTFNGVSKCVNKDGSIFLKTTSINQVTPVVSATIRFVVFLKTVKIDCGLVHVVV